MKQALLPALIAGVFAANGAIAADRELLFGPTGVSNADSKAIARNSESTQGTTKTVKAPKSVENKAGEAAKPVQTARAPSKAAPVLAVKEEAKAASKPVIVAARPTSAPAPGPASAPASAPAPAPAPAPVAMKEAPKASSAVSSAPSAAKEMVKVAAPVSAPLPAPVATPVMPTFPVMPALSAPVALDIKTGDSPLVQRSYLVREMKQQIVMGFFPSAGGDQSTTAFITNFMPLANHLSSGTGVLTTFLPERQTSNFVTAILENRYPAIFINSFLAVAASDAGYVPVAVTKDALPGVFLVRDGSSFKKIEDIRGARIAYTGNSQSVFSAFADLHKRGINAKDNRLSDVGAAGHDGSIAALISGAADVAIVRSVDAAEAIGNNKVKMRAIHSTVGESASGLWIRRDLIDTEYSRRLQSAILQVDNEGAGSGKVASVAFARGYGVSGKFVQPEQDWAKRLKSVWAQVRVGYPALFQADRFDSTKVAKNLQVAAIGAHVHSGSTDMIQSREAIAKRLRAEMSVGFIQSDSVTAGLLGFFESYLPLSNHLSLGTDVLVNFLPERDLVTYAKHIGERRYPAVFINGLLTDSALKAGYAPLAVGTDSLRGAFVIKASSPVKKLADLRGASIYYSGNSQSAFAGFAELAKLGISAKDNRLNDVRGGGHQVSMAAIAKGIADVAIVPVADAKRAVDASNGSLRFIETTLPTPSSALWVRQDVVGTNLATKLESSLIQLDPDGKGSAREAADAFKAGFSVEGRFSKPTESHSKDIGAILDQLRRNYPSLFPSVLVDVKKADQNMKKPAVQAR